MTADKNSEINKSNALVEPMEIVINGDMYECMFITITKDQFEELASIGKNEHEDELTLDESEVWSELEDEIMGDSLINGFTFNDSYANFTVTAGLETQVALVKDFISESKTLFDNSEVTSLPNQPVSYYLIYEKWSEKATKSVTINNKFDPHLLKLTEDECLLPTGQKCFVADVYYGETDLEFIWSETSNEELYVYCSDGKKVALEQ